MESPGVHDEWPCRLFRDKRSVGRRGGRGQLTDLPAQRTLTTSTHPGLVGDKRQFALEAMVLDGGRTDIYLISYLSTSTVEEMWQA